jgi:hypothetical protein
VAAKSATLWGHTGVFTLLVVLLKFNRLIISGLRDNVKFGLSFA